MGPLGRLGKEQAAEGNVQDFSVDMGSLKRHQQEGGNTGLPFKGVFRDRNLNLKLPKYR